MDYSEDKAKLDRMRQASAAGLGGNFIGAASSPTQPQEYYSEKSATPLRRSTREHIYQALRSGERAAASFDAAQRAAAIIEKHPEFAELLDALNEL